MLRKLPIVLLALASVIGYSQSSQTFHDFRVKNIFGDSVDLSAYHGKKVMVVNTATFCQFTPQYFDLEALYSQSEDSNFVIIGFPCNDFGGQEPGGDSTIYEFCVDSMGIQFPMMSKISITAPDTAEVYKWLQKKSRNGVSNANILWNFYKFLIDEAGNWVAYYPSTTSPLDQQIIDWIRSPSVLPPDTTTTGIENPGQFKINTISIISGMVKITLSNARNLPTEIKIFSSLGQLISTVYTGIPANGEIIQADISAFEKGIYFLNVVNGSTSRVKRFSVVK